MTEKINSCLVVCDIPKNGKTFASKSLASKSGVKLIPFDEIFNIIAENTKKF